MDLGTLTEAAAAVVVLLSIGAFGGTVAERTRQHGRCPCGHPLSCIDKYTGRCTGQVRVKNYVSGARRGFKYVPCTCTEHRPVSIDKVLGKAM